MSKLERLVTCIDPTLNGTRSLEGAANLWFVNDAFVMRWYTYFQLALGVLAIIGNVLVIVYIYSEKKSYRGLHVHAKASLAVSDILLGVLMIAMNAWDIAARCEPPLYLNDFVPQSFYNLTTTVGTFHLCAMSLYR